MGSTYSYKCITCKYQVAVSGGKDRGFEIFTETKVCPDCKKVLDVGMDVVGDMKSAKVIKRNLAKAEPRCPECGSFRIKTWKVHDCPKCGGKMKRNTGGPVYLWD